MKVTFRKVGGNSSLALEAEQEQPSSCFISLPSFSSLCKVPAPTARCLGWPSTPNSAPNPVSNREPQPVAGSCAPHCSRQHSHLCLHCDAACRQGTGSCLLPASCHRRHQYSHAFVGLPSPTTHHHLKEGWETWSADAWQARSMATTTINHYVCHQLHGRSPSLCRNANN